MSPKVSLINVNSLYGFCGRPGGGVGVRVRVGDGVVIVVLVVVVVGDSGWDWRLKM
jgi:hypothetical protein